MAGTAIRNDCCSATLFIEDKKFSNGKRASRDWPFFLEHTEKGRQRFDDG
jgi:hypothetical protein